jgi:protein TonB
LDPSERIFATFYEPRSRPRLTRKTLLAIGITALAYGAIGFYFMNQKYEIVPFEPIEGPVITVEPWREVQPPPKPAAPIERPLTTRKTVVTQPTTVPPLPIPPSDEPVVDAMPIQVAPPVPTPPTTVAETGPSIAPPPTPAPPGVIRNPVWISRPTPEQVGKLYPERALNRGVTGSATLWCGIRANGTMTGCQVVDESPTGWRFGAAALSMAQYFRISPKTIDGKPVEGSRVRIPVVFALPE